MAPARMDGEDDDPVTAEYDVYLTPSQQEQVLLLQYPNRARTRPYNERMGARPQNVRMKDNSGFIELDVQLNTTYNFNKYKSLQWGDALQTSKDIHNSTGTYGPAAGFHGAKPRSAGRLNLKDPADRDNYIRNELAGFYNAEAEDKVMRTQSLGGQIIRHSGPEEAGKPVYFVGAFKDNQLHLTKVDGTAQMRPQFHHLDAEDQRARIAASRAALADSSSETRPQGEARALLGREKKPEQGEKDRLEDRMRKLLQDAEAEEWVGLEYVDEDQEDAYQEFHRRMFVGDVEGVPRLRSGMDSWEYLDAISAPRRESPGRRRKRPVRRRAEEMEIEDGEEEVEGVKASG